MSFICDSVARRSTVQYVYTICYVRRSLASGRVAPIYRASYRCSDTGRHKTASIIMCAFIAVFLDRSPCLYRPGFRQQVLYG